MGQQYDNTNRGALFPNDRKTKDNQPDYKGQLDVDGVEYWVSGWVKDTQRGEIVSLSIEPKDQNQRPRNNSQPTGGPRTLGGARPSQNQTPPQSNVPPNNSGGGWGQGNAQGGNQEPPMDFDDDIPF